MSKSLLIEDSGSCKEGKTGIESEHFSVQLWQFCKMEQRMKILILAFALGSSDRLSWMIANSQLVRGCSQEVNLHKLEGLRFCGRV